MNRQFWKDLWFLLVFAFGGLVAVMAVSVGIMALTQGTLSLHLVQWSQNLLLMLLPAVLWVKYYKKEPVCDAMRLHSSQGWHCAWAALLVTVLLPQLSVIEDSGRVICEYCLPENINAWAADMLAQQEVAIESLLAVDGFMGWIELILLMCIATAIGEEMMFRGALLRCFESKGTVMSGSKMFWTAFWVGLLFAACHGDLYGLLARWILGLLFVYIVYWTGSLWPAVIAHAVNNFWALIQMKCAPEWMDRMASGGALFASIVVGFLMIKDLSNRYKPQKL